MGLFGKKEPKPFVSNNMLVEIINGSTYAASLEGIDKKSRSEILEKQLERRYLYRNVESIESLGECRLVVKYKDLKVRSEFEVKKMREEMEREAGLNLGR